MKKSLLTLFSAAALILGASTSAFAEETNEGKGTNNFGQMKQMMEEMHPGLSTNELVEKHKECHGTIGAEPSNKLEKMNTM